MDNYKIFSKSKLENMNIDPKYGSGWIKNLNNINNNENVKIYATNDSSISTGRKYVALPANKILTNELRIKYGIIE